MTISKAVGIDLGNTYSGVAVWEDDNATMIMNDQNKRRTLSTVALTKSTRLVGDEAKQQMIENPKVTVYDLKRLLGRHYYDFQVQEDLVAFPFTVVDIGGEPMVKVKVKVKRKQQRLVCLEELSAMVLRYLRRTAEQYIKSPVEHCVISVPAYFNYHQQQATQKAAKLAGFKSIHLIDEPTTAAVAYSMHMTTGKGIDDLDDDFHHVIVIDFGGDYLQATILNIEQELIKVKTNSNDMYLGGKMMTAAIVDDVIGTIKETRGLDVSNMNWSMRQ